jgi:hypothetical protein
MVAQQVAFLGLELSSLKMDIGDTVLLLLSFHRPSTTPVVALLASIRKR